MLRSALIVSVLSLAACAAAPPAPPPLPADFEVAVGSGGGFTGAWRTTRLRSDGSLVVEFSTMGRVDAEVPAGRLDDARRREAWTLLKDAGFGTLGCEPGNMTDDVEFRADGVMQRACASMGQGSPEFRRIHGEIERLVGAPAAGVRPPPPPLPPMPLVLVLDVESASGRFRVARTESPLPEKLAGGVRRLADEAMQPLWDAVFASHFYSGASVEERDGVPLSGAPYSCGTDSSVRVTSGDGKTWETRQRCIEGDAQIAAFAAAVVGAASP